MNEAELEEQCIIEDGHWNVVEEQVLPYDEYRETDEDYAEIIETSEVYCEIEDIPQNVVVEGANSEYSDAEELGYRNDENISEDETVGVFSEAPVQDVEPLQIVESLGCEVELQDRAKKTVILRYSHINVGKTKDVFDSSVSAEELLRGLENVNKEVLNHGRNMTTNLTGGVDPAVRFPFRCSTCCKGFSSAAIFESHQEMHVKLLAIAKTKRKKKEVVKQVIVGVPSKMDYRGLKPSQEDIAIAGNHITVIHDEDQVVEVKVESTYHCYICGQEFLSQILFQEHCSTHGQDVTKKETSGKKLFYTCLVCDLVFTSAMDRKEHEKTHEPDQCSICGDSVTRRELQRHIANHSKPKQQAVKAPMTPCPTCSRLVKDIEKHMLTHATEMTRKYKCFHCPEKFDSVKSRDTHEDSHGVREKCPDCSEEFTYSVMRTHISHRHNTKPRFGCEICGKMVVDLGSHMALHKRKAAGLVQKRKRLSVEKYIERSYVCPYCMNRLGTERALKQHIMRLHDVGDNIFCRSCTNIFKTESELAEHRLVCGQKKSESTRQCPICAKVILLARFGAHVRFHAWQEIGPEFTRGNANEPAHAQCPRCPAIFQSGFFLANHIVSHYGLGWDFECSACHKCFSTEVRLLHHRENGQCHMKLKIYPRKKPITDGTSDSGEKRKRLKSNWACSECMEVFATKLECQSHIAEYH